LLPRTGKPVEMIVAFFAMVLVMAAATRGKPSRRAFALLGLVAVLVMAASCGSPATGPQGRTLPGTYILTITAWGAGFSDRTNVTFIVK